MIVKRRCWLSWEKWEPQARPEENRNNHIRSPGIQVTVGRMVFCVRVESVMDPE